VRPAALSRVLAVAVVSVGIFNPNIQRLPFVHPALVQVRVPLPFAAQISLSNLDAAFRFARAPNTGQENPKGRWGKRFLILALCVPVQKVTLFVTRRRAFQVIETAPIAVSVG